ncbi:hypothetical protein I7V28_22750 [Lelliottia amnigena]|jgi:hypothetical protein|nr:MULTISPECIES: hypothetical protein [Lelliottia]MBL5884906.1 hypothetical protein [Lelliottia aquatilis]MBL5923893.1 hypothetical protein [Lelliottia amnigena]MBL5932738.1 hypothetical protein [Lelliottia amnigena]
MSVLLFFCVLATFGGASSEIKMELKNRPLRKKECKIKNSAEVNLRN